MPYEEATALVQKLGIKTQIQFRAWRRGQRRTCPKHQKICRVRRIVLMQVEVGFRGESFLSQDMFGVNIENGCLSMKLANLQDG